MESFDTTSYHAHVDVGGVQLPVDLFVDASLALVVEVLPDPGWVARSHLAKKKTSEIAVI
jgi:hypothetical protein